MSYHVRHTGLGSVTSVINAAAAIVEDPCLSDVADLVLRLHNATTAPAPAPLSGIVAPAPPPVAQVIPPPAVGIGLCKTVLPLQAYVWARENPWIAPIGLAAVVGAIFLIGYESGRGR